MLLWTQKKYVNFVASSLRNFKETAKDAYNFSCPYCGDSAKNSRKARGYLYTATDTKSFEKVLRYMCHNCGITANFKGFLKTVDPFYHDEYVAEIIREKYGDRPKTTPIITPDVPKVQMRKALKLTPITDLQPDHPILAYVKNRLIPESRWSELYWTDDFKSVVMDHAPEVGEKLHQNDARLCLVLRDSDGTPFGVVGRSLASSNSLRYITIKFDDQKDKIYGLHRYDRESFGMVLEGPIDSLFLPNSTAMCGGSINPDVLGKHINKDKTFICLDNEPRKKETIHKLQNFSDSGWRVVVWKGVDENLKDINDMIKKGGLTTKQVLEFILNNSFSGLRARNEIAYWKKI